MRFIGLLYALIALLLAQPAIAQPAPAGSDMEIRTKKAKSGFTVLDMVGNPTLKHNAKRKCLGSYQTGQSPVAFFDDPRNARLRYMLTRRDGAAWSLWVGVKQGRGEGCYVLYMAGTQLALSDYIQDKNQASTAAYFWNSTSVDPKAKCAKVSAEMSKRSKSKVACFPFNEFYDAMRYGGTGKDIAFTGMIETPGGRYILYGFANQNGDLLIAQTDRDGATVTIMQGRNFNFTATTASFVFKKRTDAENADRQAKAEQKRRADAERKRILALREAERKERLRAAFRASRASETPTQSSILDYMNTVVRADSESWFNNKYVNGTMHNLRGRPDPRYPKTDVYLTADYFYNDMQKGSVTFHMINGRLYQVKFFDRLSWRKPNVGPNMLKVGIAVAILVGAAAASR